MKTVKDLISTALIEAEVKAWLVVLKHKRSRKARAIAEKVSNVSKSLRKQAA